MVKWSSFNTIYARYHTTYIQMKVYMIISILIMKLRRFLIKNQNNFFIYSLRKSLIQKNFKDFYIILYTGFVK